MSKKFVRLVLVFSVVCVGLLVLDYTDTWAVLIGSSSIQQGSEGVRNLDTGRSYATIQEAIDASDTLDGHRISVSSGVYRESVTVNKSVSVVGEAKDSTIIDGNGASRVVYIVADNVEVRGFTIQNGTFGMWLHNSDNSEIVDNLLQDGSYGIRLLNSRNSLIIENTVRRYTFFGFEIDSSGNCTLRNNVMENNRYNFGVDGKSLFDFVNDIDASNTVNGKAIHYLINQQNIVIDSSTFQEIGYLGLVNSTNIKVHDLSAQENIQGILLAFAQNSTIRNVNARSNWNGIYATHSSEISVEDNDANQNFDYGIKLFDSPRSRVTGNNVDNNGWGGIGVFWSSGSIIDGNEASYNSYNLHVVFTNNSVISKNVSMKKPGGYSIALYYSHNNSIYHNMLENTLLYSETRNRARFVPRNNWDNGVEGNYWTTYGGSDRNLDGLGDAPRNVGENNTDNHPLMGKLNEFTVTLEDTTYRISVISNSTVSELEFSPGDGEMSFKASGRNGTVGFLRVAVPKELLQGLEENLGFLVNGEIPGIKRQWADDKYAYFYFYYTNISSEPAPVPWLIIGVLVFCISMIGILAFLFLKRKS